MRKLTVNQFKQLDPRQLPPQDGHHLADSAVVFVAVLEVVRDLTTIIAPLIAVLVITLMWLIEKEPRS